jgi:hypothetical protein
MQQLQNRRQGVLSRSNDDSLAVYSSMTTIFEWFINSKAMNAAIARKIVQDMRLKQNDFLLQRAFILSYFLIYK